MTKRRPTGRLHDALNQALGTLTMAVAAEVTGLSESHLRAMTDPDSKRPLSLAAAVKIDRALIAAGEEPLLLRWYAGAVDQNEAFAAVSPCERLDRARVELHQAILAVESQPLDDGPSAREIGFAATQLATEVANLMRMAFDLWDRQLEPAAAERRRNYPRLVNEP